MCDELPQEDVDFIGAAAGGWLDMRHVVILHCVSIGICVSPAPPTQQDYGDDAAPFPRNFKLRHPCIEEEDVLPPCRLKRKRKASAADRLCVARTASTEGAVKAAGVLVRVGVRQASDCTPLMATERGSVESHEDAAHRALHHQYTLLGVALLRNIHKRNSFSPKRAIGNSN